MQERNLIGQTLPMQEARETYVRNHLDTVLQIVQEIAPSQEQANILAERILSKMAMRFANQPLTEAHDEYLRAQTYLLCAQSFGKEHDAVAGSEPASPITVSPRLTLARRRRAQRPDRFATVTAPSSPALSPPESGPPVVQPMWNESLPLVETFDPVDETTEQRPRTLERSRPIPEWLAWAEDQQAGKSAVEPLPSPPARPVPDWLAWAEEGAAPDAIAAARTKFHIREHPSSAWLAWAQGGEAPFPKAFAKQKAELSNRNLAKPGILPMEASASDTAAQSLSERAGETVTPLNEEPPVAGKPTLLVDSGEIDHNNRIALQAAQVTPSNGTALLADALGANDAQPWGDGVSAESEDVEQPDPAHSAEGEDSQDDRRGMVLLLRIALGVLAAVYVGSFIYLGLKLAIVLKLL